MGEELINDVPLPRIFEQAQQIHARSCNSQLELDELIKGCRLLEECQMKIDKLGLFSSNEEKEDIATATLKFLLVPYYLGELTEKLPSSDRLELLKLAEAQLLTFVRSCESLELVPDAELQTFSQERVPDVATRRAEKIARFKRQRAAEEKIQEIKERKERKKRSTQAAASASVSDYREEDMPDEDEDEDEDEEREAWFMQISLALCKVFDFLEMLHREDEMLAAIKEENKVGEEALTRESLDERHAKAEAWHKEALIKAKFSKPAKPISCASFAQNVIEGRASLSDGHQHTHHSLLFGPASLASNSITTERERLAAQVFQPSYRLPTMSIEEAGLREMEIMKEWTERNFKLQEEANSSWVDDQSTQDGSDDEAAEKKARAWDDWKDEHPRGAGNKKLTPCG